MKKCLAAFLSILMLLFSVVTDSLSASAEIGGNTGGENLLLNGGFELGSYAWDYSIYDDKNFSISSDLSHTGDYSQKLEKGLMYQAVVLPRNGKYSISVYLYGEANSTIKLKAFGVNKSGEIDSVISETEIALSQEWREYSLSLNASAFETIAVGIEVNEVQELYADDFTLCFENTIISVSLQNSDFETGDLTGWTAEIQNENKDTSGVKINKSGNRYAAVITNANLYQTVTLPVDATYTLSAYMATNNAGLYGRLCVYDGEGISGTLLGECVQSPTQANIFEQLTVTFSGKTGQKITVCAADAWNGWMTREVSDFSLTYCNDISADEDNLLLNGGFEYPITENTEVPGWKSTMPTYCGSGSSHTGSQSYYSTDINSYIYQSFVVPETGIYEFGCWVEAKSGFNFYGYVYSGEGLNGTILSTTYVQLTEAWKWTLVSETFGAKRGQIITIAFKSNTGNGNAKFYDDAYVKLLSSIETDTALFDTDGIMDFDEKIKSYDIGTVNYSVTDAMDLYEKIIIKSVDDSTRLVVENDEVVENLQVGKNRITVYSLANDGTQGTKYHLNITRCRLGDLDADKVINASDLCILKKALLGSTTEDYSVLDLDVNKDTKFDICDLIRLKKITVGDTETEYILYEPEDLNALTDEQNKFYTGDYENVELYACGVAELSRPEPIILTWDYNKTATEYEVRISKNSDMSDCIVYTVDTNSLNIYNLFIGTEYYWNVKAVGDDAVSETACFETASNTVRNIYVDGVTNFRDLGGHSIGNNKTVNQGLIYRSARFNENLTSTVTPVITEKGLEMVSNVLKIKSEIDLRMVSNNEVGALTDESVLGENVNYYQCPMGYDDNILSINSDEIVNVFKILADRSNYPIVFHCSIGTDRTGMVAFLIEALLGVSEEDIYRDYLMSNFGAIGSKRWTSVITSYIDIVDGCEGNILSEKVYNYLISIGVSSESLDSVISIMTE